MNAIGGTCRKALLFRNTMSNGEFFKKRFRFNYRFCSSSKKEEEPPFPFHEKVGKFWYPTRTPEEVAKTIDTTLTPAQKEYVEKLKRMMKGPGAKPSKYRDVPKPEDLKPTGNFMPNLAENAEELIDWALSHVPMKMGTRGTRRRKRMALKWARTRLSHATRKQNTMKAKLRKEAKLKGIRQEVREMRAYAVKANEELEVRRKHQLEELYAKHKDRIDAVMQK